MHQFISSVVVVTAPTHMSALTSPLTARLMQIRAHIVTLIHAHVTAGSSSAQATQWSYLDHELNRNCSRTCWEAEMGRQVHCKAPVVEIVCLVRRGVEEFVNGGFKSRKLFSGFMLEAKVDAICVQVLDLHNKKFLIICLVDLRRL